MGTNKSVLALPFSQLARSSDISKKRKQKNSAEKSTDQCMSCWSRTIYNKLHNAV